MFERFLAIIDITSVNDYVHYLHLTSRRDVFEGKPKARGAGEPKVRATGEPESARGLDGVILFIYIACTAYTGA